MADFVIYKIVSPKGNVYIGKTNSFKKRMDWYRSGFKLEKQPLICRSIKKYGLQNHSIEIIDEINGNNDFASDKEMFWIRSYMSNRCKYPQQKGLNLTDGGEGMSGYKQSDEMKRRLSEKMKNNPTQMTRLKTLAVGHIGAYKGRKRPSWVGEKMSKTTKGRPLSLAHKKALSLAKKGKRSNNKRPILIFKKSGEFVSEYLYVKDAIKSINGTQSAVYKVLIGEATHHKNYTFKYK
jgi:group I intron endonuclease